MRNGNLEYTSRYSSLGQGAEIFAVVGPYLPRAEQKYGPRYNVQRSLAPLTGAVPYAPKQGPTNDIRANGAYLPGQLSLQALADFKAQQEARR